MSTAQDLLVEIGTEELPASSLVVLSTTLEKSFAALLEKSELSYHHIENYATPRRLAIIVYDLQTKQPDRKYCRRGPALSKAYDDNGNPTKALLGFAKSCNIDVRSLSTITNSQGEWVAYEQCVKGQLTDVLLPEIITTAIGQLNITKQMRWGSGAFMFARPVHWLLVLFGNKPLVINLFGISSGQYTYGHRFHAPQQHVINTAKDYVSTLGRLFVKVDYQRRSNDIVSSAQKLAQQQGAKALIDPKLLMEVSSLVEWPVIFIGSFDKTHLTLPKAVLISSMKYHQKYFPVVALDGQLLPYFIAVTNIVSSSPDDIKKGNERVLDARLNDAGFSLKRDLERPLADLATDLKSVVFQEQLGHLFDKSKRLSEISVALLKELSASATEITMAKRAAFLAKCDLLTEIVSEFPELQGVMGGYYAAHSGEPESVATALAEQYLPRFSKDNLPGSFMGQILSVADKLDTLVGLFAVGQAPSGSSDPFALRRAALGILRILIENKLPIDLQHMLANTAKAFPKSIKATSVIKQVNEFLIDRLRQYYLEQGVDIHIFNAVAIFNITQPLDFHLRVRAIETFLQLPASMALIAANKRISNLLKKVDDLDGLPNYSQDKLLDTAEHELASALISAETATTKNIKQKNYTKALIVLADLQVPVNHFFDQVMVMCDDKILSMNRLALLQRLQGLFMQVADISKLKV